MVFVNIEAIEYVRQPAIRLVLPSQPCIGFIYTHGPYDNTHSRAVSVAACTAQPAQSSLHIAGCLYMPGNNSTETLGHHAL